MGVLTDAGTAVACGGVTDAAAVTRATRADVATELTRGPELGVTSTAAVRLEPLLLAGPLFLLVVPTVLPGEELAWLLDGADPVLPSVSACAIPAPLASAAPTPSVTAPAPSQV